MEAIRDFNDTVKAPIASCSKWLSAALVMTFVDEGRLKLDETLGRFLPVMTAHQKGGITIRDCLSHLTAINGGNLKDSRDLVTENTTTAEVMEKIASCRWRANPAKYFISVASDCR